MSSFRDQGLRPSWLDLRGAQRTGNSMGLLRAAQNFEDSSAPLVGLDRRFLHSNSLRN